MRKTFGKRFGEVLFFFSLVFTQIRRKKILNFGKDLFSQNLTEESHGNNVFDTNLWLEIPRT